MVKEICGSYKIKIHPELNSEKELEIDFTPPFRRIDMMKGLEEELKVKFPEQLDSEESIKLLDELCKKYDVLCPNPRTPTRMIDKLCG